MKKILKFLSSRVVTVGALILVQAAFLLLGLTLLINYSIIYNIILQVLSIIVVIYILAKNDNPMYKTAWIIPILIFPIFGGLLYLLFGKRNVSKTIRKYMKQVYHKTEDLIKTQPTHVLEEIKEIDPSAYKQSKYIFDKALAPIYKNTYTKFLTPGEEKFESMIAELKKAEHYIFLEYFIIEKGIMWNTILEILLDKVKNGVSVKLMYDDLGSVSTLPSNFAKKMNELGIETRAFNPFKPSLDVFMNYRDHRKICVIDGNVGFTGGINLADEYINAYKKHGYWKDSSILIKGEAVWNLTILFLQLWDASSSQSKINYFDFKPTVTYPNDGYVQPFGDSPIDDDLVGETTYMNIINNAKKYVYISTPYLILDHEMITALTIAAQCGVDVRIVTPHIADKWFVHAVTRSTYEHLISRGVKIYEFTPGFIHAKTVVADDEYAIVGTTNFDFRSFYLHFECGVFLYQTQSVMEVKEDYYEILKVSHQITMEDCKNTNIFVRILRAILGIFSPLM